MKRKILTALFILFCFWGIYNIGKIAFAEVNGDHFPISVFNEKKLPNDYKKVFSSLEKKYEDPKIKDMKQNYKAYPIKLLELLDENGDTLDFVHSYPNHQNIKDSIQVSEIEKGMPTLFQWDTRWGYEHYGEDVLALTGCAPTSLSMVLIYLKQDITITPILLASYAVKNSLYLEGQGTLWAFFEKAADSMGVYTRKINITKREITNHLKNKHPIILRMKAGDFTKTGHFIVLSELYKDGTIHVHDPNSKIRSEMHWDINTLLDQATAGWTFYN